MPTRTLSYETRTNTGGQESKKHTHKRKLNSAEKEWGGKKATDVKKLKGRQKTKTETKQTKKAERDAKNQPNQENRQKKKTYC